MILEQLQNEIDALKKRNEIVDTNKAWEVSTLRRFLVAITTYLVMTLILYTINVPNHFLNAIVPTLGYLLSTFSVEYIKKIWINKVYKR